MRWYPLALFLFLFWLPNYLDWVASPAVDYWGMLLVAIGAAIAFPGGGAGGDLQPGIGSHQAVSGVGALAIAMGVAVVLPHSAILLSLAQGGFSMEAREDALKLAPVYVPVVVNVFRDAVIPFLLIRTSADEHRLRWYLLWVAFAYFATFNLAKSFVIINTLAIIMALVQSPVVVVIAGVALFLPVLALLAFLYSRGNPDIAAFIIDFIGRRILTLTAELGVNVREFVEANGYFWGGHLRRDFEYELFSFIQHSDLASGWANVYGIADAFGRGGGLGIALFGTICCLYLLFFWLIIRPLDGRFAVYLWALFCTYIFMQGIFSLGLVTSFVVGPSMVLAAQSVLLDRPRPVVQPG